jgi:methionine aminotransferase
MIKSKLPEVGTTIFSVMSKMALEYDAINLSQGFPNFAIDPVLKKIYHQVIDENTHQYPPMAGNINLLKQLSMLIEKEYKRKCNTESEILVTAGATQGVFTVFQALVFSGDEVAVLDPCYDCYDPAIRLSGGIPIHIPLSLDYLPDWNKIEAAISDKTKMLLINNPHNPSGRVWSQEDLSSLKQLMEKYPQLILLSDEVYEFITFEKKHLSLHGIPELWERTIITSSFGKTFHITGWKVGYLVAPTSLMTEIKKVHQFLVFSVNSVVQETLAQYLNVVQVQELGIFYQAKRDFFRHHLEKSRFKLLPSEGSYFQVADYSEISDEKDVDFAVRMIKEFGVATIPLSVFSHQERNQKHIRFCYAKTDETMELATEKLCKI